MEWLSVFKEKCKKGLVTERSWYFNCGCLIQETFTKSGAAPTVTVEVHCDNAKYVIK